MSVWVRATVASAVLVAGSLFGVSPASADPGCLAPTCVSVRPETLDDPTFNVDAVGVSLYSCDVSLPRRSSNVGSLVTVVNVTIAVLRVYWIGDSGELPDPYIILPGKRDDYTATVGDTLQIASVDGTCLQQFLVMDPHATINVVRAPS
ncbi:hypothetical protein [Actinoplanes philippinensis]|uniref:hypothetical protein n=1 Tax=Actinoplanes philippinensis TaxID=35752 RepID=UPI0033C7A266